MSIALTTHKVAAAAVGVAMVFSFAFVTPASAQTVEDLTAQINSLLATIASLQAQLAGISGGSTTTTGFTFTLNHSQGDSGGEVMEIQKFLNAQGNLVATTGAGSPGNETSFFGARTHAAVVAWQNANSAAVLAPVGLTAGTGFWGPSSRAHANSLGGVVVNPPTTPPATGTGVTVSAAAQPSNALAPQAATRVPFTKFTVTNNSAAAQTVNNVTVKRTGLAQNAAFDGVVLLDQNGRQLGNSRVINSDDTVTVGEAVTIQPGQSITFTVAANMKSSLTAYAGEVATFSVISVNTSATVAGSLPIVGAAHTINATLGIGSLTTIRGPEDPGADQTEEIGTVGEKFTALKFTAGSEENIRLWSIRFDMSGSASVNDLANVKAMVDGTSYPTTVQGDYYVVEFPGGIVINEGLSKEVVIMGDIIGGTNRTIAFDIRKHTDIYATGETFGYGVKADDGNTTTSGAEGTYDDESTPAYDAYDVTISAGTFNSVTKSNAAPASNIAKQLANEVLGAFTVDIKGEGIQVQTINMDSVSTDSDAGGETVQITNVTLVDQNGVVLAGPVDSTSYAVGGTDADALTFSNVTFPTGVTTVFVKGQLNSNWENNDTVAFSTQPSTDWSDATGLSTGDTVTLPSATAQSNTMTVKAASLSATTLTQPAARSIVAGATDVVFATANLDAANSGEDIRVTGVVLEDTASSSSGAVDIDNVEIWANLSGGTSNDSVRGDRFETRVADAEQFTGTTNGDNTLSITLDTNVTVPKNGNIEIAVVADLASSAFAGGGATAGDTHTISLDTDAGDVTATGRRSGNSVTVTPTGAGQTMTVASGGTLTVTLDSSSPKASLLLDNTSTEQTVGVFRFAANNVEALDVDSIKITDIGTTTNSGEPAAKYVFYRGSTKLGEATPTSGTAEVFLSDGTLTVPANGNVLITVKAVLNNVVTGGVLNSDTVRVSIAAAGDVDTTGNDSGTAVDSTATAVEAEAHEIYEGYPTFAFNNSGVGTDVTLSTNQLIAKIVVTNPGDEDVTFQSGDGNNFSIQVSVVGDDTDTGNETVTLKDFDGTTLDTATINSASGTSQLDFDMSSVGATVGATIPANSSRTWSIFADTSDLEDTGDLIQVWLDDVAADVGFGVDGAGDHEEGDIINRGDIFGPAITKKGS